MKRGEYTGVFRLSSKTNIIDCHKLVSKYLHSIGAPLHGTIGDREIWVRRYKGRVLACGPTPQSVTAQESALDSKPHASTE